MIDGLEDVLLITVPGGAFCLLTVLSAAAVSRPGTGGLAGTSTSSAFDHVPDCATGRTSWTVVPAEISVSPELVARRFAPEVETAVYFCCLEALQNATKYAGMCLPRLRLTCDGGVLEFSVSDPGLGFDARVRHVRLRTSQHAGPA
ncbi:hypothetical protein [Spirillospora sp. NPDC047279]|uniref:hypothetical protein n=1 Tax=Spirillospora sp. NPDC047279 TaxID=3155478 RepID=UPI0033DBA63D